MGEKDLHKEIEEIFLAVYDSVSKFSGEIEEIASTSHQLTTFVEGISSFSAETYNKVLDMDDIFQVIKNIAKQSNLLALNAAIEAARAGEFGKGFSVVAKEMGNLAILSKESAESVSTSLDSMIKSIEAIAFQISEISNNIEAQATTIEKIASTSENTLKLMQNLTDTFKEYLRKEEKK